MFWAACTSGVSYYVICDGHVQAITYSIDAALQKNLGSVADGQVVDTSQL